MPIFVALLRGVNVGKAKRVPMADFRALLGELGYTDVATLLNSGNAVFRASTGTPAKHAAEIASAIAARLAVEVPVIVKSAKELSAIVSENGLAGGLKTTHVYWSRSCRVQRNWLRLLPLSRSWRRQSSSWSARMPRTCIA